MIKFFDVYREYISEWGPRFVEGAIVTAELSIAGFAVALVVGAVLAAMQEARSSAARRTAIAIVQFLRSVPLLALLLALYFGLPTFGLTLSSFAAGVVGLGLQGAAYVAEVLRGGLRSVHRGQREAGIASGMKPHTVFIAIVLPQAMRVMMPPLLNCYVSLLKDSSLCSLITTNELMLAARAMSSEYFLPLHIFLLVGLFYFAIAFPLSMLSRHMEAKMQRGRRALGTT